MWEAIITFVVGLVKSKQNKVYISIFLLCTGIGYGFYVYVAKPGIENDIKITTDSLGRDGTDVHREIHAINKKLDEIIATQQQQNLMLFDLKGKR